MRNLITVIPASHWTALLLGEGRETGAPLVWTSFLLRQPTDEGLLLYNTLTLELLHVPSALLPALEAPTGALRDTLRRKWFLVPRDLDQHAAALELRSTLQEMEPPAERLKKYTVFTTTACNARCFYCYEQGWAPRIMSLETADRLADYMLAHSGGKRFKIAWFGGEPLLNLRVIDRICTRLQAAGANYQSQMNSNGFLFTPEIIERAVTLWRLAKVQIALDGLGETYDRIKDYKTDGEGAFRRVTDNIAALTTAGIMVHIRMNYELYNLPEIEKLADWLLKRYAGNPRVRAYPVPLFEDPDDPAAWHTDAERETLCAAELAMRDRLAAGGLSRTQPLPREPVLRMCMADSGCKVTVLPDGALGLCQNYDRSGFVGSIDDPELDETVLEQTRALREEIPACADCPIFPGCIRLKLCPNQICYPQRRRNREEIKKRSMLMEWKQYKRQQGRSNE